MPHPCPHHCPKPGGGAAILIAIVVLVVIAAAARPVVHGAELVLEVAAIAATSTVVLVVFGAAAYVAVRARKSRANRVTPVSFPAPVARRGSEALSAPRRPAIETLRPTQADIEAPRRGAIEAPRPSLADIKALAAEHGYDIVRRDRGD